MFREYHHKKYPDYIGVKYRKYRMSQAHKDHIIIMTDAIHGAYES